MRSPPRLLTPKSVIDGATLARQLKAIRKQNWACAVDDVALGLTALAVPVRNRQGRVVCAVSIAGLTPQMMERGRPVHLDRLQTAAARIESELARR